MKTIDSPALFLLTFLFTHATLATDALDLAAEKVKLDGTWVGGVKNGSGSGGYVISITEFVIKDGKIKAKGGSNSDLGAGTYTIDVEAKPKTLDAVGTAGKRAGMTYLGIYKLDGDTLEWCVSRPGDERPKDFFTKCPEQDYMIFKRQNPVAAR